jgi:hypothetical protein
VTLATILAAVPRELVMAVADVVSAILAAPNQKLAARRAAEAARRAALDLAAKKAKPRKGKP